MTCCWTCTRARSWLDNLAETGVLEAWDYAFATVIDTTLEAADNTEDLDLTGHGIALVVELFIGGRAGVPVTRLSESVKSAAIAEGAPESAERQWKEWTEAHGDPPVSCSGSSRSSPRSPSPTGQRA